MNRLVILLQAWLMCLGVLCACTLLCSHICDMVMVHASIWHKHVWVSKPLLQVLILRGISDQEEFTVLSLQGALPQSTCFCLLEYTDTGFKLPNTLDFKRTQALLQTLLIARLEMQRLPHSPLG